MTLPEDLYKHYSLSQIINARGTFTPLGVSRSSERVCHSVAAALGKFFIIDELQYLVSQALAGSTGAEAGVVTHCTAASITLSVAALMTGDNINRIQQLPDTSTIPNNLVLPAGHAVNYGHPLEQAIRLAGASPLFAGTEERCEPEELKAKLDSADTIGLLLVDSRLTKGQPVDLTSAVSIAHQLGKPVIIDGAAQDLKIGQLLQTGADLVLVSAQKYLASPTAGLVLGRKRLIDAVRLQERGIGRAMKATKESIIGVLTALEERAELDTKQWKREQDNKVKIMIDQLTSLPGIHAFPAPDPTGLPFSRVHVRIDESITGIPAAAIVESLKADAPQIWVIDQDSAKGEISLELIPLTLQELTIISERFKTICLPFRKKTSQ